jgi:hypothetical protein
MMPFLLEHRVYSSQERDSILESYFAWIGPAAGRSAPGTTFSFSFFQSLIPQNGPAL